MIVEIPLVSTYPVFEQVQQLDGVSYTLKFNFNARDGRWYLSVYDVDAEPIVLSIGLVPDMPLLAGYVMEGVPPGELLLLDSGEPKRDPTRSDLGARARLFYADAAEVGAL